MLRHVSRQILLSRRPLSSSSPSTVSETVNSALNDHIRQELKAARVYFGMHAWFQRPDVALRGVSMYFLNNYREELRHAEDIVAYQSMRGGTFAFTTSPQQSQLETRWSSPKAAVDQAIGLEEALLRRMVELKKLARQENDCHLDEFLCKYILEQIEDIGCKTEMRTLLERAGSKEGLLIYDKTLQERYK